MKNLSAKMPKKSLLHILLLTILMFSSGALFADKVLVTFRVNMKEAYPTNGVYIGSDWTSWSLTTLQKMEDTDNDSIFELTVYLPVGMSYNYRYTRGNTNWGGFETLAGTMCGAGPSGADRNIVIPDHNTVLDVVCFGSCLNCGETPDIPLNLSVDMTGVEISANGLHVAGSFNNWNPASLAMTDDNNDHIYEITVPVIPKLDYEYKFLNGNTLNDAEVVFGTCEFRSKRRVSVDTTGVTVPVVKFESCNATGEPITDIKIACIGNSITEGGAGNHFNSWPIQLRDLLGAGYYTENLGVSGTTMSKVGDSPWWNKPQYGYTFDLNPDIVLIKLGTNDSKSFNWKPDHYKADYIDMIDQFRAMPSHPEIYMVTPAKAYSSAYNISDNTIVMNVIPIIRQIAFEKGVNVIDVYNATTKMAANFPDGIHPNATGAGVIAQKAKDNLMQAKPVISQVAATTDTTTNVLYQWFLNDSPIPESHLHTINVTQSGTYKVAVRMANMSNDIFVSDEFLLTMPKGVASVGLTTDYEVVYKVNNTSAFPDVRIYPNPASSAFYIENAKGCDVTVFNELGNVVLSGISIDKKQSIEIPELSDGIYLVRISRDRLSETRPLIVNRD